MMVKQLTWAINACENKRGLGLVIAGINRTWTAQNQSAPLHVDEYRCYAQLIADLKLMMTEMIAEEHERALSWNMEIDRQRVLAMRTTKARKYIALAALAMGIASLAAREQAEEIDNGALG